MALGIRLIEDEKHLPLPGICCERYPFTAVGLQRGERPSLSASLALYLPTPTNALSHTKKIGKTKLSANKTCCGLCSLGEVNFRHFPEL